MTNFNLTEPCERCCFRINSGNMSITGTRAEEIVENLLDGRSYICPRTQKIGQNGIIPSDADELCAGAMIMLENYKRPTKLMKTASNIGMYDKTKLNMKAKVFATFADFIRAMHELDREFQKRTLGLRIRSYRKLPDPPVNLSKRQ